MPAISNQEPSDKREARVIRSFSLSHLMVLILAVCLGLAASRLEAFGFDDGCFAAASVFVVWGLASDIRYLRSQDLSRADRRFHTGWRWLLLVVIVAYFPIAALESQLPHTYLGSEASFAPQAMLVLAFFSAQMLDSPARVHSLMSWPTWAAAVALFVALVWFAGGHLMYLVQIAIQAMEISIPSSVWQYEVGSESMFEGVDMDLSGRASPIVWLAALSLLPLGVLILALGRLTSRIRTSRSVKHLYFALVGAGAASIVFPVWFYVRGLRQMCPAFAETIFHIGIVPACCAFICLLLIAILIVYRSVAKTVALDAGWDDRESPLHHLLTLVMIGIACTVWFVSQFRMYGAVPGIPTILSHAISSPQCYVALATLFVVTRSLFRRLLLMEVPPRTLYAVPEGALTLVFPGVVLAIVIGAPTVFWFVYSLVVALSVHA